MVPKRTARNVWKASRVPEKSGTSSVISIPIWLSFLVEFSVISAISLETLTTLRSLLNATLFASPLFISALV